MIPRYQITEVSTIWEERSKFNYFLEVEKALLKALEEEKIIPQVSENFSKVTINLKRIHEIENVTHHDVIAFCSSITEQVSADVGKYFHFGCTSSDIIDTSLSLQLRDSLRIELRDLETFISALKNKAIETKSILTLGRSHGMYAEPMSFGFKFLSYLAEAKRVHKDLSDYEKNLTGKISGAVGNYTILSTRTEEKTLSLLGLKVEELSTQIIPRDHLVSLAQIQARLADLMERLCIEIRHLHRSDVGEVVEGFKVGQKGSSTMPHKKNPISAENISGLSRILRSHENIAHENTLLWHERDISHSSNERMWLPDSFGIACYILRRGVRMINELYINKEVIEDRTFKEFRSLSSFLLHQLLPAYSGSREDLYSIIQAASFECKDLSSMCEFIQAKTQLSVSVPNLRDLYQEKIELVYQRFI